jgi:hypothetical protein
MSQLDCGKEIAESPPSSIENLCGEGCFVVVVDEQRLPGHEVGPLL